MDFIFNSAWAQAGGAPAGGGLVSFLPLILLFVVFYFLLIRPQMKRAKEHRKMVGELAVGDEVLSNGGLLGVIRKVGDTFLDVDLGTNIVVKMHRHQVSSVLPKGTWKSATTGSAGSGNKSGGKAIGNAKGKRGAKAAPPAGGQKELSADNSEDAAASASADKK